MQKNRFIGTVTRRTQALLCILAVLLLLMPLTVAAQDTITDSEGDDITDADWNALVKNTVHWDPEYELAACGLDPTEGRTATAYGTWDPLTLEYPAMPDEAAVIEKTKQYIQQQFPDSPFASNLQYVDQIFSLSLTRGVNPLLVMAIAQQENGFGRSASEATAGNNYFGIKDPSTGQYRQFPSVEAGIDWFVQRVGENVTEKAGSYADVKTFYEYISVHQLGFIAYPNEYPQEPGKSANPPYLTFDPEMGVYTSWVEGLNPGRGDFNPGLYYANGIKLVNAVTGLSLPSVPSRSGGCGGQGAVNADGYAFPLAPQTKRGYSNMPCNGGSNIRTDSIGNWSSTNPGRELPKTCHHDNTAAFDLAYPDVQGKPVYAIVDGEVVRIKYQQGTCYSLHLKGNDGFYYWYGHITSVEDWLKIDGIRQAGSWNGSKKVAAGDILGVVDTHWRQGGAPGNDCKNASGGGTSSGSHLHIDRGCTTSAGPQRGGVPDCRDPDFIPLLKAIYDKLES